MIPIGTIIDKRPDGSTIYMSSTGVRNLDPPELLYNKRTNQWYYRNYLSEAIAEDTSLTKGAYSLDSRKNATPSQ